jgi:hypothetical protein
MTPEKRRQRAVAAQALIADETIKAGWVEIENEIRAQWEACLLPRKRDRLWTELRHLKALRHRLATYAGHIPRI